MSQCMAPTPPGWWRKTTVLIENFPMMPLSVNCGLFEWAQKAASPVCGLSLVKQHRVAFSRGGGLGGTVSYWSIRTASSGGLVFPGGRLIRALANPSSA